MSDYPTTVDELVNRITVTNMQYVADIMGTDQKRYGYGLSLRGSIDVDDEQKSVLGSVVLEKGNGDPINCEGTIIFTYSAEEPKNKKFLFRNQEVAEAMKRIYQKTQDDNDPFVRRDKVQISNAAK